MTLSEVLSNFVDNPCYETSDALKDFLTVNDVEVKEVPSIDFGKISYLFDAETDFGKIMGTNAYFTIVDFLFPLYYKHQVTRWGDTPYRIRSWVYAGDKRQ